MKTTTTKLNGIDTEALARLVAAVEKDPGKGIARFAVTTAWKGGTRTDTRVERFSLGSAEKRRAFTIPIDEPEELLGANAYPNPQEVLMAAANACIAATFVAACAVNGIRIDRLEIETTGELDLRGFLALDPAVKPGYESLTVTLRVAADAPAARLAAIREHVLRTSPNVFNLAHAVPVDLRLVAE